MRRLTIVSVAYPFAPVSADPVGGAEQVLAHCDRALVAAGHRSIVIAPEGSSPAGELRPVPAVTGEVTAEARARVHDAVRARIAETIGQADLIHLHGIDFAAYLPPPGPPLMVTLHLPLDWYDPAALAPARPRSFLHPVSASQARRAPPGARLCDPIANGVPIPPDTITKRGFALILGRMCPEKGFDDALDAAHRAAVPLIAAGQLFPYPEHRRFFEQRVVPRLDAARRWIGPVAGARKARLLAAARCVLVPSKAPETSSLVAMEAIAAGTPVIAYRVGALPDIVEEGITGFLVDDVAGMAVAIGEADRIDPAVCRAHARACFALERMTDAYLARYAALTAG